MLTWQMTHAADVVDNVVVMTSRMTSVGTSPVREVRVEPEIGAWRRVQRMGQLVESLSGSWGRVGTQKVLILAALCKSVYDL